MFWKFLSLLAFIFSPIIVFGQQQPGSLQQLLLNYSDFIDKLILIVIFLALLFFLSGMASFILNSANEEKRTGGKQKMIWGIIALSLMIGIWGVVKIIQIAVIGTTVPGFPTF